MELVVYKINGEATNRKVRLSEDVFGIQPNDHAIYLDVKQYLANQRQGTHKSKEKSEVSGSTKKIKRQKGTGTARAGSLKSPVFVGGGRIFGPKPRDYGFKLNKKLKQLARRSALAYKAQGEVITLVEDFTFEAIKTKQVVEMLNNFKFDGRRALLVMNKADRNVVLSARNLQNVKVVMADNLNTYEILNASKLFVVESAVSTIEQMLS
ncbi:MAG TPA: 50S ribosomal protein L4 [Bacteroidales bacterium]|nr:50S ribosomal protein L4 [Bacteroidales bacterium]